MEDQLTLSPVAYYEGPLTEKFGLPRQSGLVPEIEGTLVFTPPYRMREAFRGMEGFSHLWLIWGFCHPRAFSAQSLGTLSCRTCRNQGRRSQGTPSRCTGS